MEYRAESLIQADPHRIWEVLTDASSYPDWDSGVEKVEGRVAAGEKIKVYSQVSPGRAFPVKVSEFEAGRRMVWKGGMPLGLFTGVRSFELRPEPGGATRFTMHERFSGPLLRLIGRSMPDLGPSFDQFARGLKERAERDG